MAKIERKAALIFPYQGVEPCATAKSINVMRGGNVTDTPVLFVLVWLLSWYKESTYWMKVKPKNPYLNTYKC